MVIETGEDKEIILKEVFNEIILVSDNQQEISICMRDSGFEFSYNGYLYSAQDGEIRKIGQKDKELDRNEYM